MLAPQVTRIAVVQLRWRKRSRLFWKTQPKRPRATGATATPSQEAATGTRDADDGIGAEDHELPVRGVEDPHQPEDDRQPQRDQDEY